MEIKLKIGILLTDHVLEDLQEKHGDQTDFYTRLFDSMEPSITLRFYDVVKGEYPKHNDECNGYIITGSRLSVYDEDQWIKDLEKYICELHKNKKSLIGVCFGHQLIAKALGGLSGEAEIGWLVGVQKYSFKRTFPWVKNQKTSIALIHSHKDQVKVLPPSAHLVAGNEKVPISMYFIGNHIMSMQGHPEFTSEYAFDVATKRHEILGRELFLSATRSLKNDKTDNLEVAKWWVDFLRYNQ